jgi:hypothetical protein
VKEKLQMVINLKLWQILLVIFFFLVFYANKPEQKTIKEVPVEVVKEVEKIVEVDKSQEKINELEARLKEQEKNTLALIEVDNKGFVIASQMLSASKDAIEYAYLEDDTGLDKTMAEFKTLTNELNKLVSERQKLLLLIQ